MLLVDRFVHGHNRPACLACGFVHYAGPKVAVGVVVFQDGRILLNRRAIDPGKGRWSFPSGYVDLGELGIADRWWDVTLGAWSTTWNVGPGYEDRFYEAYGVERDDDRIAFYRLLYDLAS